MPLQAQFVQQHQGVLGAASPAVPSLSFEDEEHKPKKRPRGAAREPNCPKCDNPKCHKSHTYQPPCQRSGQTKPVRAKPKQDDKKLAKIATLGDPMGTHQDASLGMHDDHYTTPLHETIRSTSASQW